MSAGKEKKYVEGPDPFSQSKQKQWIWSREVLITGTVLDS